MRRRRPGRGLEASVADRIAPHGGETLVVACSGGPDSVALAALAARVAAAAGASVVLGHVAHGVRAAAAQDEAVVLAVGAALRARVVVAALPSGDAAEARLRDLRYVALARIAASAGARRVLTAHHAADQTESVLLALFRGAGPGGTGGMAAVRALAPGIALERPLLDVAARRLRAYCLQRHLPYAVDRTNDDAGYRRVALRRALASLRASFPGLDEAVARHAALARDAREPDAAATLRGVLRREVTRIAGDARDLGFTHLDRAAHAVADGRGGRYFLRRGVELVVTDTNPAATPPEGRTP